MEATTKRSSTDYPKSEIPDRPLTRTQSSQRTSNVLNQRFIKGAVNWENIDKNAKIDTPHPATPGPRPHLAPPDLERGQPCPDRSRETAVRLFAPYDVPSIAGDPIGVPTSNPAFGAWQYHYLQ